MGYFQLNKIKSHLILIKTCIYHHGVDIGKTRNWKKKRNNMKNFIVYTYIQKTIGVAENKACSANKKKKQQLAYR